VLGEGEIASSFEHVAESNLSAWPEGICDRDVRHPGMTPSIEAWHTMFRSSSAALTTIRKRRREWPWIGGAYYCTTCMRSLCRLDHSRDRSCGSFSASLIVELKRELSPLLYLKFKTSHAEILGLWKTLLQGVAEVSEFLV
jgi:hypothetical protein